MKRRIPRPIQTANQVAMNKKVVRKRIDLLKIQWKNLDNIERGERLNELLGRGCSSRGLEKKLNVPATTIRRYYTLAKLPKDERAALRAGETQKKALARNAARDRSRERNERIAEERKSGALSDELAKIILDFVRFRGVIAIEHVRDNAFLTMMNATREYSRNTRGYRPAPMRLPLSIRLKDLYDATRPRQSSDDYEIDYEARWLATILISLAPEEEIRETAMNRAERDVWEYGISIETQYAGLGLGFQVKRGRLSPLQQPTAPSSK